MNFGCQADVINFPAIGNTCSLGVPKLTPFYNFSIDNIKFIKKQKHMGSVNFREIKKFAKTQYGDLTGVIQVDLHSGPAGLYDLCKDYGFDTHDKFILGFGLNENTTQGIGKDAEVHCRIWYVKISEYGNNFEEIKRKILEEKTLKINQKLLYIKYTSLFKYIKRYDFLVTSELTSFADFLEIQNTEE